jgi:hypothetical protein
MHEYSGNIHPIRGHQTPEDPGARRELGRASKSKGPNTRAPYGLVIQTTTPISKPQPQISGITTTKPITMVITMVINHVLYR